MWLRSARDYNQGLDILKKKGASQALIMVLEAGPTAYNKKRLDRELFKIAEQSVEPPKKQRTPQDQLRPKEKTALKRPPKEHFPKELHAAYERQTQLYTVVNHIHPQLDYLYATHRADCHKAVRQLLAAWQEINSIYAILDYWTSFKQILPNRYQDNQDEFSTYTAKDWLRYYDKLTKRISRNAQKPEMAAEVNEWKKERLRVRRIMKTL